jgi:N6-L-threonylcarbamoyladenine synthase
MLVLGIETTCDETAAAVVKDGKEILSNVIFSQAKFHEKFGGVFPEMASRMHYNSLIPVIDESLKEAKVSHKEIDLIAVALGPGLMGALFMGLNAAKTLAWAWDKPYVGVHHVEAHLYASMMEHLDHLLFPSLGVVLSGGHTLFLKITAIGNYELIGTTIDDAIGESFDKVAAILGLPYPGGPAVENLAKMGKSGCYGFKAGLVKEKPFHFSFSGLKTKVLYTVKGVGSCSKSPLLISEDEKKDVAASFQETVFDDVIHKANKACRLFDLKAIYFGGGVVNNEYLRKLFKEQCSLPLFWPSRGMSLDNGAMIAGLGFQKYLRSGKSTLDLEAKARLPFFYTQAP